MSAPTKKLTRREFTVASFSAGLAALAIPLDAWAQEPQTQQAVEPESPPSTKKSGRKMARPRPEQKVPLHVDYSKLQLVATIQALDTHLDLSLHLLNTSDDPVDVPHTMGGIPNAIPKGELVLSQQKLALEFGIPPEMFEHITRAANVDYLRVQPSGKDQIKTFFARYISPWPEAIIEDQKRYAAQEARVDLSLTLERWGLITRTGKSLNALRSTTEGFRLPKTFKSAG